MSKKKADKKCVRCVKRYSLKINEGKWNALYKMLHAYCLQKDAFLMQNQNESGIYASYNFREVRNSLVAKEYESPFALQARQWKLALKDALETLDRYWAAMETLWKDSIIEDKKLLPEEKAELLNFIRTRRTLFDFLLLKDKHPNLAQLKQEQRDRIVKYLRDRIQETVKQQPRVKIERSFLIEPETYRTFENKGRQYIAIMSMEKGERLIVPLTGKGKIEGQARIVLDSEKRRIEVHFTQEHTFTPQPFQKDKIGIDFGITEVFTDSDGERWGTAFGKTTQSCSDEVKNKGQKRNKLHAIEKKQTSQAETKKYKNKAQKRKAANIRRCNLGRKKLERRRKRRRQDLTRQINEALNKFLKTKEPEKIVHENLSNLRGKAKSKNMSRLVSSWIRTTLTERLEFKAFLRGSQLVAVSPAYSSTTCPRCGWVDKNNRTGDTFTCRFCGHTGACDFIAAVEILRRENDPEILRLPKEQVRLLLIERFRRRLESDGFVSSLPQTNWEFVRSVLGDQVDTIAHKHCAETKQTKATVPGKTPDAFTSRCQPARKRVSRKRKPLGERN